MDGCLAEEICGDHFDDNCVAGDDDAGCPQSQPAGITVPTWDCVTGAPPASVVAWARFGDGPPYFDEGACAVFFEGLPGELYVTWTGLVRHSSRHDRGDCGTYEGCVCPSDPPYDRRLYAFTLAGAPEDCEALGIRDHAGNDQPVSNACRRYLYALHGAGDTPFYARDGQPEFDLPFSYVSGDRAALLQRLTAFPTVEVACAANPPNSFLPYATLMTAPIELAPTQ